MAEPAPIYDLVLLLVAEAPEERRAQILTDAEAAIAAGGGEIVSRHDWGVRNLAYEIRHVADADYHLLQFTGPPELPEALSQTLRITDGVMRHRVIRLAPGTPPPPEVRAERTAAAEPVEAA